VKINACKNATPNSKVKIASNNCINIISIIVGTGESNKITKPVIICNNVWPAIIFANNRTDNEIVLNK